MTSQRCHSGGPDCVRGAWNNRGWRQRWKSGRARGRAWRWERTRSRPTESVRQLLWQALSQSCQLLLPLPYEVVQVALTNQKGGFGADEAAVVLELQFGEVAGQDGVDQVLPPVEVLLQLQGVFSLTEEQRAFVMEGVLSRRRQQNSYQFTQNLVYHQYFSYSCLCRKPGLIVTVCTCAAL